jgi:hypothetical protein
MSDSIGDVEVKAFERHNPDSGTRDGDRRPSAGIGVDRSPGVRPVVKFILDFDGVVQARFADAEWPDTVTAMVPFVDDHGVDEPGYMIQWSPTVIRELDALRSEYDLALYYLTTWLRPGNALECFLDMIGGLTGGTRLQIPARPEHLYPRSRWKINEVHRLNMRVPGPVIWVDDLEVPNFGDEVTERELGFPSLTISPHTSTGLTAHHLEQIRAFCEKLR